MATVTQFEPVWQGARSISYVKSIIYGFSAFDYTSFTRAIKLFAYLIYGGQLTLFICYIGVSRVQKSTERAVQQLRRHRPKPISTFDKLVVDSPLAHHR